ncbi:hypothetical protein BDF21DRAFT_448415 [Thamnidium elegans]|uniref:Uncharacterized protein n=1 Tax=Thamnidium elegans TaxID=101142 RepID=A0A8H7VX80_9FUNG|nr:hypothetical protein INT48_000091 [Thamnidium elegans]KAI8094159.1 hypothetical protein BDF21DRAFT_448415 [Thamnidium elegans]
MLDNSTDNLKCLYIRSSNGVVSFGLMAAAWSKLCSSDNYIYYKTPKHLCSYNNILEDRRKYRDTVAHNIEASRSIRLVAQSKRRYKASVPSKKYRRLQSSTTTLVNKINAGRFIEEGTILTPVNIAPRVPDSGTSAQVTSSSQIDRRDNNHIEVSSILPTDLNLNLNSMSTVAATRSSIKSTKRVPGRYQLCQNYSPTCKGSLKPKLCQFKCGICVKSKCMARYGGKEECIFNNNTEAMKL